MAEPTATPTRHAFAASFGQRSLWFLDQFEPGQSTYNIPIAIRLTGPVNFDLLERALRNVVARHESLRTQFELHDGELVQVVESDVDVPLVRLDLTSTPQHDREAHAQAMVTDEADRPFDLSHAPLLRALVVGLHENDCVLLLTVHHTIADGWSVGVLLREVGDSYNALLKGDSPQLANLDIQFGDFSTWQIEAMHGVELGRQVSYWRDQLSAVPVLDLPIDRPRPSSWSSRGAELAIDIPRPLTDALVALARKERATLFMALLAVYSTLLRRHSGQTDIAIGTSMAGRNRVEIEPLIGFFVNTLVMRTAMSGDPTFREWLSHVRTVTLGAFSNQDVPFERVVEELKPERAMTHTPLCQTMLILHNTPPQTLDLAGVTEAPYELLRSTSKFELTLSLREVPEGLRGVLAYSSALFDQAKVARMADHVVRLIESVCAAPDRRLSELPMLSDAEQRQLVVECNDTRADYSSLCLHELFAAQVARTPDAPAAIADAGGLTYRELNQRADGLAARLGERGIGRGGVVGVSLERSLNLVVALVGILKAGAAYLPLDPSYPALRLKGMLEDSEATLVISESALVDRVPPGVELLLLDRETPAAAGEPASRPKTTLDDLAYVLFTSGSTGRPKGVMLPHRAVCNYVQWMQASYPLSADDRVLQRTPTSFDLSVWEFFLPLTTGAAVVMAPPSPGFEPTEIVDVMVRHRVTIAQFVPALLGLMLDEPGLRRCTALRRVFSGGAALTPSLRDRFFDVLQTATVHNMYGPTETCINSVAWNCERGQREDVVPMGRPIANTQVYVLGEQLELLPMGTPGELLIGGAGVARGYINRPDLTADRFIAHPLARPDGQRLYRTGDRVRYRPDRTLEFLGRNDDQVKIRGIRVELQEVAASLARHPGVQQSVVVARTDPRGDAELVAYYVPARPNLDEADLQSFMRESLPDGMVPSWFVKLSELPLAPNGKLDRRALPEPSRTRSTKLEFVAPRNETEEAIARIWRERLRVESVGIHDNFFDLGGHSLLAAHIVTEMRQVCGANVPLRVLFEAPTIAGVMARLMSPASTENDGLVSLHSKGHKTPFFCVHGVGGEVFSYIELANRLDPERPVYGLRAPPWSPGDPPITMESLAAYHVRNVLKVSPSGPYLLGGYSAGSTVAFEMAQQLAATGNPVRLVVAIDSQLPNLPPVKRGPLTWMRAGRNLFWWIADDVMQSGWRELSGRLGSKAALAVGSLAKRSGASWIPTRETDVRDMLGIPWAPDDWAPFLEQLFLAQRAYRPRPYAGRVALLRARTRPLLRLAEPDLGWNRMASGVDVRVVRGSHSNILHVPNVQELADRLREVLDHADVVAQTPR